MENGLFIREPSSKILEEKFVEARLHTDRKTPEFERNLEIRDKYVGPGNIGRPVYFVLDPHTLKVKNRHDQIFDSHEQFARFLGVSGG